MFDEKGLRSLAMLAALVTGASQEADAGNLANGNLPQVGNNFKAQNQPVDLQDKIEVNLPPNPSERLKDAIEAWTVPAELGKSLEVLGKHGYSVNAIEAKSISLQFVRDGIPCSDLFNSFSRDYINHVADGLMPAPLATVKDFLVDPSSTIDVEQRVIPLMEAAAEQGIRLELWDGKSGGAALYKVNSVGERDDKIIPLDLSSQAGYRSQDNLVHALLKMGNFENQLINRALGFGVEDFYRSLGNGQSVILRDNLTFRDLSWRGIEFKPSDAKNDAMLQIKGQEIPVLSDTKYIEVFRGNEDGAFVVYVHNNPTMQDLTKSQCTLQRVVIDKTGNASDPWGGERSFGLTDTQYGYFPPPDRGLTAK